MSTHLLRRFGKAAGLVVALAVTACLNHSGGLSASLAPYQEQGPDYIWTEFEQAGQMAAVEQSVLHRPGGKRAWPE